MSPSNDYDRVQKLTSYKNIILAVSTIITLLLTLNEKYKLAERHQELRDYVIVFIGLNSILIILYVALNFRADYIFTKAEKLRRLQYLDNSFDTNFAGKKTENYFTQDNIEPGFYKLCSNCFENSFHTFNIVKQMQNNVYTKAGFVLLIFIFSASVGDKSIVRALIEAILPLSLVQDAIKISVIVTRLESILDNFRIFFSNIKNSSFSNKEPEAMRLVIDYETTLAWASLPLDSKVFLRLQKPLSEEWEILKNEYEIKNLTQ